MGYRSKFKLFVASAAAATSIVGAPSAAWADALPVGPSMGVFTASEDAFGDWAQAVPFLSELFKGVTFSDVGFSMPVSEVTVDGQGPGPVRIGFGPNVGVQMYTPELWLLVSDVAFDVGAQALTADLRLLYDFRSSCPLCADVIYTEHAFDDLPLAKAGPIMGAIDGAMPLNQAVLLQTLVPQQLELSTDLYMNIGALNAILGRVMPDAPALEDFGDALLLGSLRVSPVPEMSTNVMLTAGLLGMAWVARRRRTVR